MRRTMRRPDGLRYARAAAAAMAVAALAAAAAESAGEQANMTATANPRVILETNKGAVTIELWPDKAPLTVANFLAYVDAGFYDGLVFHRVIDGFMIQGGGFTPDMRQKPTRAPVRNEARADVPNARGTLAMARTSDVDSATAQFFINLADNGFLNHKNRSPEGFGYCAFGRVTDGMDTVDAVAKVATRSAGSFENAPVEPVIILRVRRATP